MPDTPTAQAAPKASATPKIPAALPIQAPVPQWSIPHEIAAGTALNNLTDLGSGASWGRLGTAALPSALIGGGLAWGAHRLLAGKGRDEEDRRRKRWQRWLLAAGGALAGGYAGANREWKYAIAPELRQGLAKSVFSPGKAFADGMDANYRQNLHRAARLHHEARPSDVRGVVSARDLMIPRVPVLQQAVEFVNPLAWAPPLLGVEDPYRAYRVGGKVEASPGSDAFQDIYSRLEHNALRGVVEDLDPASAQARKLLDRMAKLRAELGVDSPR